MISSILERLKGNGSKPRKEAVDHARNQTYLQLHKAQREHSFVEVTLPGDTVIYQTMILSVDPEERTILIDEFFPTGFFGMPGQRVNVCIRQKDGGRIKFATEIMSNHMHEGAPLYVLLMPRDLESDQRRNAYRLPLGESISIDSNFIGPDQTAYTARIKNLSRNGLAMQVKNAEGDFHFNDKLKHVAFDFVGVNIDCDLAIRSVEEEDEETGIVIIGGEFIDISPAEQNYLNKSIMKIQRNRIRMMNDMASNAFVA